MIFNKNSKSLTNIIHYDSSWFISSEVMLICESLKEIIVRQLWVIKWLISSIFEWIIMRIDLLDLFICEFLRDTFNEMTHNTFVCESNYTSNDMIH